MKTPTQYHHSTKSSRDSSNHCFSLTFQVSGLHSSVRTKKTLPFVRAGQLIYVFFFCLFVRSLLGCRTRHLTQSRCRCSALNAQRPLCQKLPTLDRRAQTLQSYFLHHLLFPRDTHRRRARDVVLRVSLFASRKSLAASCE